MDQGLFANLAAVIAITLLLIINKQSGFVTK